MNDESKAATPKSPEVARREAVERLKLLDTWPEERFDRLTRLARQLFRTSQAWIGLVDGEHLWLKSIQGREVAELPLGGLLLEPLLASGGSVVVEDAARDPLGIPLLHAELELGFYLAHALRDVEGTVVGALCLADSKPRRWLAAEARTLGDLVALVEQELCSIPVSRALDARDQAELALHRQFELYTALLQAQSDLGEGVVLMAGGRILHANQAFTQISGYSLEELTGLEALSVLVTPEERALLASRLDLRQRGFEENDRYELGLVSKSGQIVQLEVAVKTTYLQERPVLVLLIRDVTESRLLNEWLRESEERYRQLSDAAFEAIALSENGVIVDINPAHIRMFGYEPTELVGRSFFPLVVAEARDEVAQRVLAADDRPYETVCRHKDGTTFPAEVRSGSFCYEGRVVRVTAVRDITERRAVEKLKDEFLSVVSHELRTPLTSIRGSLGLMASGKLGALPPKADHLLSIAVNNTDRLVRLINDLLDIERLEAGKCSLVVSEASLDDLMAHAVEVVRHLAERAQVHLEVAPAAGTLWGDADRIEQLLTNLLSNAIKFSPPGGVIRLHAERQEAEWRITVSDQGRGIPHDKLEVIFGRFQQVDASDARQKGGTGLGLAICRSIAQQHGGRIWAESTPGEGSTFIVCLPMAHASLASAEEPRNGD